jgi:hypothetical protein
MDGPEIVPGRRPRRRFIGGGLQRLLLVTPSAKCLAISSARSFHWSCTLRIGRSFSSRGISLTGSPTMLLLLAVAAGPALLLQLSVKAANKLNTMIQATDEWYMRPGGSVKVDPNKGTVSSTLKLPPIQIVSNRIGIRNGHGIVPDVCCFINDPRDSHVICRSAKNMSKVHARKIIHEYHTRGSLRLFWWPPRHFRSRLVD